MEKRKLDQATIIELQYRVSKSLFSNLGLESKEASCGVMNVEHLRGYKKAADVVARVLRKAANE